MEPGSMLPELVFGPLTSEHLVRWACASGDFHAIHYDKDFAASQGLPGVIMHGPFKFALAERLLRNFLGQNGTILSLSCTYKDLDPLGVTLVYRVKVTGKRTENSRHLVDLDFQVENDNKIVTVKGKATLEIIM